MKRISLLAVCATLLLLWTAGPASAGEPLVVKASDGKYIPAAASEWAKSGDGFRFVLKSGIKAPDAAAQLASKIAPIKVEAPDDVSLVFSGEGLTEESLLEKLAGIALGDDKAMGDALAALGELGSAGAPSMGDLSSAGSIRASKKIDLPGAEQRKDDPGNLVGEVIGYEPCEPMPLLRIKVVRPPAKGPFAALFKAGEELTIRGYYKVKDGSKAIDPEDARTRINLKTKGTALGTKVFGKPFTKDDDEWVLETIEPM
ncbi:MAG: hypothetical protein JXR96_09570 [Deltaproteobacteria bacterium]|nr:hypothetical protein [Deltaproteobacteria bacterium]